MVFGFGEMTLPALPPPIMASRSAGTGMSARRPIASATGATVMTAMSTNTPTAVTISVASATAARAKREPQPATTASAIFAALPVFTSAPTSTPETRMRSTEGIIACVPEIIAATVAERPPPPSSPPASAPRTSAYAGVARRTISTIATASPASAPQVENTASVMAHPSGRRGADGPRSAQSRRRPSGCTPCPCRRGPCRRQS